MREAGFVEKVSTRLRSPLASFPEGAPLTSTRESVKYGFDALGHRLTAESLVIGVQYIVHSAVEGDVAEFGTHTGRTAKVLAAAMKLYRADKRILLFDSFEGMPEATHPVDKDNEHVKLGVWGKGQLKGATPDDLRRSCGKFVPPDSISVYKGWFSDSLPTVPKTTRYALLHVDCDLYASAMDVLDFVFKNNQVSQGAMIFFDDWNCNKASNDHGERKAWREVTERYQVDAESMGNYSWAGHKFIVHGYSAGR